MPPAGVEPPPPEESRPPVAGAEAHEAVVLVGVVAVVVVLVVVVEALADPHAARFVVSLLTTVRPVATADFAAGVLVLGFVVVDCLASCLVDLFAVEPAVRASCLVAFCVTAA